MLCFNLGKGILFSGDCVCVDKDGNPYMMKHYTKNPIQLSKKDEDRIIKKLKSRNWGMMLSHWGIIKENAKNKFMQRYSKSS